MKVVNIFGGPGAGKSTAAYGLSFLLKINGIPSEYVPEYAKDLTWEQRFNVLDGDQLYILAKQNRRLWRLQDQVEWAITDSPIILGLHYMNPSYFPKHFENFVFEVWDHYKTINFFIERNHNYDPIGRNQSEQEADAISLNIQQTLKNKNIPYTKLTMNDNIHFELFNYLKNHQD